MAKLNDNKGVLLISALMVSGVIFVLSGAYMSSSIIQNNAAQRESGSLQAFYAAEKGAEYIFIESQNQGWGFATHEVSATDTDGDGKINDLVPKGSIPAVTLGGAGINSSGCYEVGAPQNKKIEVKVYINPSKSNETILLSRSISTKGDSAHIIKNRLAHRSMYEFLMFFPGDKSFSDTYDGKGVGGIHVNGNIILKDNANFNNLTELSTAQYISYYNVKYPAPYSVDEKDGSRNGIYKMQKFSYPPYSYYVPWVDMNGKMVYITDNISSFFSKGAKINGITIPGELSTAWQWDKYSGDDANTNPGGKAESAVTINVPKEELDRVGAKNEDDYWIKIYGTNPTNINTEWWEDKVYGSDRAAGAETVAVKYTNSEQQVADWKEFVESNGFDAFVKDKNSGGKYVAPLNIETNYSKLAKEDGLYIGKDGSGNTEVYLNGVKQGVLPCWIEDNIQFFNAVRPHLDSDGNPVKEDIIQFDISKLISNCPGNKPNNNIVYVDNKNLRLVNAAKLPEKGLTVVSPYNIYLKGDYNTDVDWQPSSVITNSLVYTLSEDFNDPQTLPQPTYYYEFPYDLEFQDFLNKYASGARYPSDFPPYPPTGLTPSWIKSNLTFSQQKTLRDNGEKYYSADNDSVMVNEATKDTTYNTAIVAPYSPFSNCLERWSGKKRTIEGSFIEIEKPWSVTRDVPAKYKHNPSKGWGYNWMVVEPISQYNYEEKFKGASSDKPAGDFLSGSQALWEVVSDFNHNI